MNLENLILGDIVSSSRYGIGVVNHIGTITGFMLCKGDNELPFYHTDILPVLINNAFLNANFEKRTDTNGNVYYYYEDNNNVTLKIFDVEDGSVKEVVCSSNKGVLTMRVIYIHELQHIMKLFEIDKKLIATMAE